MERGVVRSFKREKQFGFIGWEGHADLFFHMNHRVVRKFTGNPSGTPVQVSMEVPPKRFGRFDIDFPELGQAVVFDAGTDHKGRPMAERWSYATSYDIAKFQGRLLSGERLFVLNKSWRTWSRIIWRHEDGDVVLNLTPILCNRQEWAEIAKIRFQTCVAHCSPQQLRTEVIGRMNANLTPTITKMLLERDFYAEVDMWNLRLAGSAIGTSGITLADAQRWIAIPLNDIQIPQQRAYAIARR